MERSCTPDFAYADERVRRGAKLALATIVAVHGSAYRRAGAHMLLADDGSKCGTISAGCLEADLEAMLNFEELPVHPEIIKYNSGADDLFELNLGCDGSIMLLLERYEHEGINPIWAANYASRKGKYCGLATISDASDKSMIGQRLFFDGHEIVGLENATLSSQVLESLKSLCLECVQTRRPADRHFSHEGLLYRVFCDVVKPAIHLYVFGTGDDVLPLVNFAAKLNMVPHVVGWKTRPKILDPALHYIRWQQPFCLDMSHENSAFVIMSHNYEMDRKFLGDLSKLPVRYIGVMGPKRRTERMIRELQADSGVDLAKSRHLHYPIGLDLGADTPAEIALSIMAEIQAAFTGSRAGFLREKNGPIHDQVLLDSINCSKVNAANSDDNPISSDDSSIVGHEAIYETAIGDGGSARLCPTSFTGDDET